MTNDERSPTASTKTDGFELPVATDGRLRLINVVRRIIGGEAEAAMMTGESRLDVHLDREWPLLERLMVAARLGELKLYEHGKFQSIALDKLLPSTLPSTLLMVREAYLPEVDEWLDKYEPHIPFRFRQSVQAKTPRPPKQQVHQGNEILRVIRELGHDPKALPKQDEGKAGVKSLVREKLPFSEKVFNKAWQKLRDDKEIADA